jgi:hypothetical protein
MVMVMGGSQNLSAHWSIRNGRVNIITASRKYVQFLRGMCGGKTGIAYDKMLKILDKLPVL